ncbi:adenosylcobinamide-phosphate synthase CbiB [Geomonas subterranea]|uniref:Cobalamin biosynthesis protein CobD n=1 Tax=Geomonas subterranea TaxID=2847989 RepID=A0ABX8LEM6_9BACT|nr:adenosylcobinamide-phosphate synthase CbiB [Geomonas subterranea]QXE90500.1 adenosylcobinamide-phosphate synthase CbiB [Geomonas subterranea]QXM11423.1 adenosylcobinamide-phosphate synthase CbiB [Geomonas subterranea]
MMAVNAHIAIVICAVLLDLVLGDPRALPHPVVGIGELISALEGPLRRRIPNLRVAGVVLLIVTVGVCYALAASLIYAAYLLAPAAGFIASLYLAWVSLAARSLHEESAKVARALRNGDLPAARLALSYIVGRETAELDEPEIIRGAVETVAENTGDGVIAPLFYLVLGGPALAIAYKAVNTLDSMVGYKNERYLEFGWASARFDDLANYLPARLTGLLMVLAAPMCGLNGGGAWRILRRDGRNHSSPNSGFPEAAAAGALGVRLGGANRYFGKVVEKPTIGDPLLPLSQASYEGVVRLMYGSEALLVAAWVVLLALL